MKFRDVARSQEAFFDAPRPLMVRQVCRRRGLAPAVAYQPLRALAGPSDGAPASAGTVRRRAQRSVGWGPPPSPRTSSPSGSTSTWRCSTGEEVKFEFGGACPRLSPALARAQRPRWHAGPIPPACAALRRARTLRLALSALK